MALSGQTDRFLKLVESYLDTAFSDMRACDFSQFNTALKAVVDAHKDDELIKLAATVSDDIQAFQMAAESAFDNSWNGIARDNDGLKAAAEALAPVADRAKSLIKELDHLYKLATRVHEADVASGTKPAEGKKRLIELDEARKALAEYLKEARYFYAQAEWLQTRFTNAELCDVEGLVKLVGREELEANDWSLTPGRYVGVAPEEEDEDFDFEEALRDIHIEIDGLNSEATELAEAIQKNLGELIA